MKTMWLVIIGCVMLSAFSISSFAQEQPKEVVKKKMHKQMDMPKKEAKDDSSKVVDMVRKGTINLSAIDKNKDGKVFQCQMDWNVISDAPGKCSLCKMKLKEVSLEDAKKNLLKNGFKVK